MNPTPDFVARHTQILAAERDIVTDARENDLRVRILKEKPDLTANVGRVLAVDAQFTLLFAFFLTAQDTS
jgi:hypothetical protein